MTLLNNTKFVKMYFDSNGVPNIFYRDHANEIRHAAFIRKGLLSYVKKFIDEDIGNNTDMSTLISSVKIKQECPNLIYQVYLFGILIGIGVLFVLNLLFIDLNRRQPMCSKTSLLTMKTHIYQCQRNLYLEKTLNEDNKKKQNDNAAINETMKNST